MTRAEKMPFLAVVRKDWLTCDQPEMHLRLSNGSHVKIQWDIEYGCRNLFLAPPEGDFASCTGDETGLHPDELDGLCDDVYRATQQEEAERLADNWDDGR